MSAVLYLASAAAVAAACPSLDKVDEVGVAKMSEDGSIVIRILDRKNGDKQKGLSTVLPRFSWYSVYWNHIGNIRYGQEVRVFPPEPKFLGMVGMAVNGDLSIPEIHSSPGMHAIGFRTVKPTDKEYPEIIAGAGALTPGGSDANYYKLEKSCIYPP